MSQDTLLPRISVITPSLNQGRFLRQCIESVLSQNYRNLEYFIIDGGSTDESLSIIQEYDRAISYWVSEPDSGQSDAINKGFRRASGEIVAWLNADDYYLDGVFERVIDVYKDDQVAPFYFGDGLRVDEGGAVIKNFFPPGKTTFDRQALVLGLNYILQPSVFINRRSLEQAGYLDVQLHYGMDSDLWMRLSNIGMPRVVSAALSATREYAMTKTAEGSFERVEELRKISMKHSGLPITPGVLCYLFDVLHRTAQQHENVFPPFYLTHVVQLWEKTQKLFDIFNARPDGFPRNSKEK